jgi:hypothetical protein
VIESSNGQVGDTTPLHSNSETLTRTIKKVNQLPALGGSGAVLPQPGSSDVNNALGTPITNKTLSKRAIGLEPLPADH